MAMTNLDSLQRFTGRSFLALLLTVILTLAVVATSPYRASNLSITPDSVEYAVGAANLAGTGHYYITVNGEKWPPRYPPWFSLLVLKPAYLLFGPDLGNAIIPVTFFSLLGVVAAFFIGRKFSGDGGGVLAAVIVLMLPAYRAYSRHVMTEIPCTALALLLCLCYLKARVSGRYCRLSLFVTAGIAGGLVSAFRPACAAFALPFLLLLPGARSRARGLLQALMIVGPPFLVAGATLVYNHRTFGSFSRNGYLFWCPEIFGKFGNVFSILFLKANLWELFVSGVPALCLAVFCAVQSQVRGQGGLPEDRRSMARALTEYIVVGTGPVVVLHLFYFWNDLRFFLPTLALLAAFAGGVGGRFFENVASRKLAAILLLFLLGAVAYRYNHVPDEMRRRETAERILEATPANALIISGMDAAYLEYTVCRNSSRQILPLSRNVEYTSRFVVPGWHRQSGFADRTYSGQEAGGVYPRVAAESPDLIARAIQKGIPVYFDTSQAGEEDRALISTVFGRFSFVSCAGSLYRLQIK